MLNLLDDERVFLRSLGALSLDSDGGEMLAGLTSAESHFLVNSDAKAHTGADVAERAMYDQILRTHLRARLDALDRQACHLGRSRVWGLDEGDVVRLKCGGPDIDVIGLIDAYPFRDGTGPGVYCVWEESHVRYEQVYPLQAVEPVRTAASWHVRRADATGIGGVLLGFGPF